MQNESKNTKTEGTVIDAVRFDDVVYKVGNRMSITRYHINGQTPGETVGSKDFFIKAQLNRCIKEQAQPEYANDLYNLAKILLQMNESELLKFKEKSIALETMSENEIRSFMANSGVFKDIPFEIKAHYMHAMRYFQNSGIIELVSECKAIADGFQVVSVSEHAIRKIKQLPDGNYSFSLEGIQISDISNTSKASGRSNITLDRDGMYVASKTLRDLKSYSNGAFCCSLVCDERSQELYPVNFDFFTTQERVLLNFSLQKAPLSWVFVTECVNNSEARPAGFAVEYDARMSLLDNQVAILDRVLKPKSQNITSEVLWFVSSARRFFSEEQLSMIYGAALYREIKENITKNPAYPQFVDMKQKPKDVAMLKNLDPNSEGKVDREMLKKYFVDEKAVDIYLGKAALSKDELGLLFKPIKDKTEAGNGLQNLVKKNAKDL